MNNEYQIKLIDEIKQVDLINFYKKFGTPSQSNIDAKILDAENNYKCVGTVAIFNETDQIVAAYLAVPQNLIANPNLLCVQSMDTLISPAHRGKYLLEKMSKLLYSNLEEKEFHCVFGVPNLEIEKLRYTKLGWNASRQIYRFTFLIPLFVHLIFKLLLNRYISNFNCNNIDMEILKKWRPKLNEVEINYIDSAIRNGNKIYYHENKLAVVKTIGNRCHIGMLRFKKNIASLDKFKFIVSIMLITKCKVAISYATENSQTYNFFNFPILKTKSMRFGGKFIGQFNKVSFGEQSIEYIEFDTWNFPC